MGNSNKGQVLNTKSRQFIRNHISGSPSLDQFSFLKKLQCNTKHGKQDKTIYVYSKINQVQITKKNQNKESKKIMWVVNLNWNQNRCSSCKF